MGWHDCEAIPFERLAAFVRQFSHDVRNGLNALDLQAAYLSEIVTEPEAREELGRMRKTSSALTKQIQALSRAFEEPRANLIDGPAEMIVQSIRDRMLKVFPEEAGRISWQGDPGGREVRVDLERLIDAVSEIFRNAFQFGGAATVISARTGIDGGDFFLEVRERKESPPVPPSSWGSAILASSRRGGYGLGLFRAGAALRVQQGTIEQSYDQKHGEVVSRITIPLSADASR